MALIQAKIDDSDLRFIKEYAKAKGTTISALIRDTLLEKIEDELDLHIAELAWEEHARNPQAISHSQMLKELGLAD